MLALQENPPIMPEGATSPDQLVGDWWVAHTKSRFEKAFAWDLIEQKIGYFLPMSPRTSFSGGRKRKGMVPLFPSYVFFCGDAEASVQAMQTNRLCNVLRVPNQEVLLSELRQIHRLLTQGEVLEVYSMPAIGTRCRVKAGPLEGVVGVVVARARLARLVLQVSMLGQGTCLDIEADLLEPISGGENELRSAEVESEMSRCSN